MSLTTLQTDDNNDFYIQDGQNLVFLQDDEALAQEVRLASLMRLGEDIFNTAAGVDYFGTIFTSHKDVDAFRVSLISAINQFDDVISINTLTITNSNGTLSFTAEIATVYGTTTVSSGSSL